MKRNVMHLSVMLVSAMLVSAMLLTLGLLLCATHGNAAESQNKRVLDLGELEVEGEVRRPPVDWIDSNKRMNQQIPALYAKQFQKLEDDLLRPITREKARKALEGKTK